jgi:hypothetical protein
MNNIYKKILKSGINIFSIILVFMINVFSTYQINWYVIDLGGAKRSSTIFKVTDSLNYNAVEKSRSTNFILNSGFISGIVSVSGWEQPTQPTINLSVSTLYFSAVVGGSNPPDQTFIITNTGVSSSILNWTADDDMAWLTLSPLAGSISAGSQMTVTVSVNIIGLSTGSYSGIIIVSDPNATNSPQRISVTLTISTTALPIISLNKTKLSFSAVQNGNPPPNQTFTITNNGASGSTLNWSASDDATWLTLSPTSGSLISGNSADVTVSVNITGLSAGTYNATITVSDPNAINSPQTIAVKLELGKQVKPNEVDTVKPAEFHFNAGSGIKKKIRELKQKIEQSSSQ